MCGQSGKPGWRPHIWRAAGTLKKGRSSFYNFFGGDISMSIEPTQFEEMLYKSILTLLFNVFGWDCLPFLYFCLISLILQIMVMYPPQPAEPVSAGFNEETGEPIEITVSLMKSRL